MGTTRASFAHYRALGQAEAWVALSARPRLGRPYSSIMQEWEWEPAVADAKSLQRRVRGLFAAGSITE